MVFLIDYILPENYFAQNLYALSADMAAFRDLIKHFLPELSSHLEQLRKEASGSIKKAYSSDNPPDMQSIYGYEPPLADVFTMQWFLTIFAASLPRKATRRVWDLIFLEGSVVLIYTAVAVLAVMERYIMFVCAFSEDSVCITCSAIDVLIASKSEARNGCYTMYVFFPSNVFLIISIDNVLIVVIQ